MSGRRIKNKIACLLLIASILGQAVYTSAFPFDNPIIDSIENLFGAIRYDVTIAELVISLLTGAGATPVNSAMAQALESELGTAAYQVGAMYEEGLFTIVDGVFNDNGFIDAIEDTAVWAQYNIADIFETTSEDVQAGIATAAGGGALNLGRVLAGAVDTGFIIEMGATGGLLAGVAVGGFGLAYLVDHIITQWGNNMEWGKTLDRLDFFNDLVNNSISGGGGAAVYNYTDNVGRIQTYTVLTYDSTAASCSYPNGLRYISKNTNGTPGTRYTLIVTNGNDSSEPTETAVNIGYSVNTMSGGYNRDIHGDFEAPDATSAKAILESWRDGTLGYTKAQANANNISPDVIGKSGNMPHDVVTDGNGNDTVEWPDIVSPLEPGQGLKPINWNDYQDLVDEANQNYTNDPTNQEDQIQIWDDFKDPYIEDTQDTPENPDNPDIPDNPDANYVPDFTDDITPDTVIDDVVLDDIIDDVVPDQPVIPDKPDLTPGEIEENLDVSLSGDITDIFPFCIPFDVIALFEKFGDIEREAPHFHFTLDFGDWGQYDVDIDLSEWDDVATLCRTLEIVIFILGLILITRDLIKG